MGQEVWKYCLKSTHSMWWLGSAMVSGELPVCGESHPLLAGVKPWFGDVSAHPCSVALRAGWQWGWRQAAFRVPRGGKSHLESKVGLNQSKISHSSLVSLFLLFTVLGLNCQCHPTSGSTKAATVKTLPLCGPVLSRGLASDSWPKKTLFLF